MDLLDKGSMYLFVCILLTCFSCKTPEGPLQGPAFVESTETGSFQFDSYEPLAGQAIEIHFHIPDNTAANSPVVIVLHGAGRNADEYRDAWKAKADEYNFLVFAPEFSRENFPGGDVYNLGNVFEDGDNPSLASLNSEDEWTYSVIEPVFDFVKTRTGNTSSRYHLYGHSAGGQFAHRLLLFKPNARVDKVIVGAPGWYTLPDTSIAFPYGIQQSPVEFSSLSTFFSQTLTLLIGEDDNDPNATSLRRNSIVDLQGTNRLARAAHFFQRSQEIAQEIGSDFKWKYIPVPGIGHDFRMSSQLAADLLFEP